MLKPQSVNEETPLMPAMATDQTSSIVDTTFGNAKRSAKKVSPWYVIGALFGLTFSYGALYAPMIQFYTTVFCYRYYQQQSGTTDVNIPLEDCAIPQVQAIVSEASAIIVLLTYTTTLLVASYYGNLSDRKGRRFVMISATLGSLVEIALFVITLKYPQIFGITLLFIAPILRSLLAGDTILVAAIQAYISDCTSAAERTVAFGNMLAIIYLGSSIGPTVGSYLLNKTNSINSIFYMVFIIQMCLGLYIWLIVPESNVIISHDAPTGKKDKTFLQRINLFSALRVLYRGSSEHASPYALVLVAGIQFLLFIVALPPILLYTMLQFGWTAYEGGLFVSLASISRVIVMLALLPLLAKVFHKNKPSSTPKPPAAKSVSSSSFASTATMETRSKEEIKQDVMFDVWMIRTGLSVETVCFILFGLVSTSAGFSVTVAVQSLAMLAGPSLRSLSTSLVAPSEIGELLGAMAVLEACGLIISQLTINTIYSASVGIMPNLIFFVCATICGLALAFSFFVHPSKSLEKTNADAEEAC
ncbi:Nuclear actin-protein involved in chromatin remodeling [Mucor velutinosus]|uniref:Nuclear actin-protein involved in chromatin remodeling n=1 Tax=Mucor velutinosus TaxID=708070 RepID=A0AAN7DTF9_9FUNG|nr:Nuclear actin-protein involved in chromatin remodeling [Mucor velutinosus]